MSFMNKELRQAWIVCVIAATFIFLQFVLQSSPSVMIPELMKSFSIDELGVGVLSASYYVTYLILQVPSGMLADQIGAKKILIWGIVLCAITSIAFVFVVNYWVAISLRMLMGIFSAPAVACTLYLCARWFPVYMFAFVVGIIEAIGVLGVGIGQYVLSHVVGSSYGWRSVFYLCAFMALFLAILVKIFVFDNPPKRHEMVSSKHSSNVFAGLKYIVIRPQAWMIGIFSGLMFMSISAFAGLWGIPYLQVLYNIDVQNATTICFYLFLGTAFGAPFMGWVVEKVKSHRYVMMFSGFWVSILFLLVVYWPPDNKSMMSFYMLCLGFFSSSYVVTFAAMKEIVPKEYHGAAMGFVNSLCILIGAPLFQPMIGYFLKKYMGYAVEGEIIYNAANYQHVFIILVIAAFSSLLIACLIKETFKHNNVKNHNSFSNSYANVIQKRTRRKKQPIE